jgi:hypothetical protein
MDGTSRRPALVIAALASAGAGLVHAAAAGTHQDDRALVALFTSCALLQLGWAFLAFTSTRRWVVVAGAAINLGAFGAWLASRTTGLPFVDALRDQEPVGRQDLVAAVLAAVAVTGCLASLLWPRTTARVAPLIVVLGSVLALGSASVGVAAPHAHGEAAAAHEHTEAHEDTETHEDIETHENTETHEGHALPDRLDHEPTPEQRADAERLVAGTTDALAAYVDVNAAVAAGYRSIGDGRSGYEHFVHAAHVLDDTVLDPSAPESLVYRLEADGAKTLTTAMYILPPGSTMDDVPDIAGNLTVWHTHDNLCFAPGTHRLAGALVDGRCRPGGELRPTAPMLHVWIVDNPCGPFAGTDRQQTTGSCMH